MLRLVLPLAIAFVVSATCSAESPNSNPDQQNAAPAEQTVGPSFTAAAERIVRDYFKANPMAPQSVPPGIANALARGKQLPAGAARPLPGHLISKLPPYPDHEVVIVGRDAILIHSETRVIADILTGVL